MAHDQAYDQEEQVMRMTHAEMEAERLHRADMERRRILLAQADAARSGDWELASSYADDVSELSERMHSHAYAVALDLAPEGGTPDVDAVMDAASDGSLGDLLSEARTDTMNVEGIADFWAMQAVGDTAADASRMGDEMKLALGRWADATDEAIDEAKRRIADESQDGDAALAWVQDQFEQLSESSISLGVSDGNLPDSCASVIASARGRLESVGSELIARARVGIVDTAAASRTDDDARMAAAVAALSRTLDTTLGTLEAQHAMHEAEDAERRADDEAEDAERRADDEAERRRQEAEAEQEQAEQEAEAARAQAAAREARQRAEADVDEGREDAERGLEL